MAGHIAPGTATAAEPTKAGGYGFKMRIWAIADSPLTAPLPRGATKTRRTAYTIIGYNSTGGMATNHGPVTYTYFGTRNPHENRQVSDVGPAISKNEPTTGVPL